MASKQIAYKMFQPAVVTALKQVKNGTLTRERVTTEVAEALQVDVAKLESSWVSFASKPKYKPFFASIENGVGEIPMVTKSSEGRGRKAVPDSVIAAGVAELESLFAE